MKSAISRRSSMAQTKTSVQASAPNFLADETIVQGYLLALQASGRAEKTVHTYASALEVLRRFCDDRGIAWIAALSTEQSQRGVKLEAVANPPFACNEFGVVGVILQL